MSNSSSIGKRAHLAVMFCDLYDSTYISSLLEPEDYSDLLDEMREVFNDIVVDSGGRIIRIDGDGFIATFGYPEAYESNTTQALIASLKIQTSLDDIFDKRNLDFQLRMHTGIHSGIVLVKDGGLAQGVYEILGDTTNIAARLCDFAGPGEIIVSDEAMARASRFFDITKSSAISISGRPKKLLVHKVVAHRIGQDQTVTSRGISAFIGRSDELVDLRNFVLSNEESDKIVLIKAEAGLGKSRLLQEFSNLMAKDGISVHHGICQSYIGSNILLPIEQILDSIERLDFASLRQDNEMRSSLSSQRFQDLFRQIDRIKNAQTTDSNAVKIFAENFNTLLLSLRGAPLAIIIDDWHWVDSATADVILFLGQNSPDNLKIILASRTLDQVFLEMNAVKTLELTPLTQAYSNEAIQAILPGVEPFTLPRIRNYSGGNPLYIEELCYAVKDARFGFSDEKSGSWLNALTYTRFSQLPENLAIIARSAAVIGHIVPQQLLQGILDKPITANALEALMEAGFLYPAETLNHIRFKHGITRDVIYDMIGLKERRKIHKRIIDYLVRKSQNKETALPHAQLAYHYKQSDQNQLSIKHLKIAGEQALRSSSLDMAQTHFKTALNLGKTAKLSDENRLDILRKYGRSCVVDPSEDQLGLLEDSLAYALRSENQNLILWSEYWLGFILYGIGFPRRSIEHFENCYILARALNEEKLITQLKANLGQAYAAACEYEKAYEYLDQAIEVKFRRRSGLRASAGLAYAISCKGFALGEQGAFQHAEECFEKASIALSGIEHVANTSILNQQAVVSLWHGNIESCIDLTARAKEMSRRMHSRYNYAQAVFISAAANFQRRQSDGFIHRMIEATNWLVYDGVGQNLSLNYGYIAESLARKKAWKEVRIYAARGMQRARHGDRRCESQILRALALTAQAGETSKSVRDYLSAAYMSANQRKSMREIENNRQFEAQHFGSKVSD